MEGKGVRLYIALDAEDEFAGVLCASGKFRCVGESRGRERLRKAIRGSGQDWRRFSSKPYCPGKVADGSTRADVADWGSIGSFSWPERAGAL